MIAKSLIGFDMLEAKRKDDLNKKTHLFNQRRCSEIKRMKEMEHL